MVDHGGGLLQPAMHSKVPMPREGQHIPAFPTPTAMQEEHDASPSLKLICLHNQTTHKLMQHSIMQLHQQ